MNDCSALPNAAFGFGPIKHPRAHPHLPTVTTGLTASSGKWMETFMINKPTLALVAALLAGTASSAFASSMDNDANTGLWSYLYYGPIADLQQQGLPVSSNAANYAKQHGTARGATKRGNVYLLED